MGNEKYQTIKISKGTHRKLRILAANTGESMLELIDRLIDKEQQETQSMKLNRDSLMSKIRLIQENSGKRFHRSSASSYTSFDVPGGIVVSARKDGVISVDVPGSKTEFQSPDAAADYIEQAIETVE